MALAGQNYEAFEWVAHSKSRAELRLASFLTRDCLIIVWPIVMDAISISAPGFDEV